MFENHLVDLMFILTFMIHQVAVNENAFKGDARINFEIIVAGGKSFIEHTYYFIFMANTRVAYFHRNIHRPMFVKRL